MKLLLALAFAATLNAAEPFEGQVTYKVSNPKGKTHTLVYSLKGEKVRVDMPTPKRGFLSVIVDNQSKETLVLLNGEKKAMKRPLAETHNAAGSHSPLTKTGKSAVIAGYACDEYNAAGVRIWATAGLGKFRHFEGGPMDSRSKMAAWEKDLADLNLFPLKLVDRGTTYEATAVEKKALSELLFQAPPGYKFTEK